MSRFQIVDTLTLEAHINSHIKKLKALQKKCEKQNTELSNKRAEYWEFRRHGYEDMRRVLKHLMEGTLTEETDLTGDDA